MRKLTWQAGKSPFLIGDTSSNGWCFIAMLVSGGVVSQILFQLPSFWAFFRVVLVF